MEPLRLWGVVNQAKFHSVRFICLEASEFDDAGRCEEDTVGAHGVVDMLVGNWIAFVGFSFGEKSSLQFNLVVAVIGWDALVTTVTSEVTLHSLTKA